jgi:hypothetical protein
MSKSKVAVALALSGLLLASCGSRGSAAAENNSAGAETNALENASPSDPGQANGSDQPDVNSFPPPDAVSHPNGFLPYAEDPPAPSAPEPTTASPPGSKEPPPATEDEYIRNKQAGG